MRLHYKKSQDSAPKNFRNLDQKGLDWILRNNPEITIDRTINQYDDIPPEETKKGRYRSDSTIEDNLVFASALEANRYRLLKQWQEARIISNLTTQHIDIGKKSNQRIHRWLLSPKQRSGDGKNIPAQYYIDDFQYEIDGIRIVEDIKGYPERVFINKMKILLDKYPNINFFLNYAVDGWYPALYSERWNQLCQSR